MQQEILDYLAKNWNDEYTEKLMFSSVPKGQSGDLAIAFFQLTKEMKKSPPQIAQEVAEILKNYELIQKTEIAGPYLNLFFQNQRFFEDVFKTPTNTELRKGKKTMVEFSSPNTNKPLHLGHMRNHALGIAVSNLFEAVSSEVIRVAIFNDRGVHICKSMLAYQKLGNGETPADTGEKTDHFVGRYYVKFDSESKKNPSWNDRVQQMLLDWENGDEKVLALWKQMNAWAFSGYDQTYARQGITFDKRYFESDFYKYGKKYVLDGYEKGLLQKEENGAIAIDLSEIGLDKKVLLRANGTTIYMTQDLHTTVIKQKDFEPDEQIWIVADEQNYHFTVLLYTLEKLQLINRDHLYHLSYGLVHLPDGRMKSREGSVVDADNLMDELSNLAYEKISERNPDLPDAEKRTIAEQVMNAAWKFYLLKTAPNKSITFEPEKSIDFQGATGPYLQYAGVRLKSIFRKAPPLQISPEGGEGGLGDAEKPLGVKILEFPQVLDRAAEHKNPTYVVTYLLELAQEWSSYYAEHSILKAETEDLKKARLALAHKVYDMLEAGLLILGIEIPEKM